MKAKDTVMKEIVRARIIDNCHNFENLSISIAKAQAEISFKAGRKDVVELCLQAIGDEPEFPGEMPDELWDKLNGNREITLNVMRNSVRLTKQAITERLQAQKKEWDLWKKK